MIYIVNLGRTCKNENCHIYVLVVFKDVSFATVPILACGGDNSQVHLYVQSSGQVCWGGSVLLCGSHECCVTFNCYSFSKPLSSCCTDPQQMQKAMSLQGHEDWVRGVAWASRSEWSQRSCISQKSNSGRSAHNTLNAVFRNDHFQIHNVHIHSLKNTDCQDACVLIVVYGSSFCQLCKPLQACTLLCVLNLFQLLNRPSLPVSPSHSQSMTYSTLPH